MNMIIMIRKMDTGTLNKMRNKTCPMSLHHGGKDVYSPNGSTLVYRQLRRMHIPAELHLYPDKGHGAFGLERAIEFMRQMGFIAPPAEEVAIMDLWPDDDARGITRKRTSGRRAASRNSARTSVSPISSGISPRSARPTPSRSSIPAADTTATTRTDSKWPRPAVISTPRA